MTSPAIIMLAETDIFELFGDEQWTERQGNQRVPRLASCKDGKNNGT